MSYLLDALRRSERERRRAELPATERVHMDLDRSDAAAPVRRSWWLLGLLALNLAAAGWWWLAAPAPGEASLPAVPQAPAAPSASGFAAAAAPVSSPESAAQRAAARPMRVAKAPALAVAPSAVPANPAPPANSAPRWPLLSELPSAERESWPAMEIAAQVYSPTNVKARFVIVDGAFLREGEAMPDGTRVVEILERSVLFERAGRRARVPVTGAVP